MPQKKWIKTNDRLPEQGEKVWYYFEPVGVNRGHFKTETMKNVGDFQCFGGKKGWLCDDVTHWMPRNDNDLKPIPPETA